jgi:putative MATE family efflux protein
MATTTGRTVGALYGLWHLTEGSGAIHLRKNHWKLDLPLMRQFMSMAFPATIQNLVSNMSWLALVRIIALFGSAAVAGYTIAIRILIFSILPAWGLSMAAATLVGQNLGAKQPDRAEASVLKCGRYNMTFLALVGVVFLVFAELIVGIFTSESEAKSVAASALRIFALGYVFFAWGMVLVQAFNGAGDTRTPTWINFGAFWLCQIPLAWALARVFHFGPSGVFVAVPVAYLIFVTTAYVMFRRGAWKTVRV